MADGGGAALAEGELHPEVVSPAGGFVDFVGFGFGGKEAAGAGPGEGGGGCAIRIEEEEEQGGENCEHVWWWSRECQRRFGGRFCWWWFEVSFSFLETQWTWRFKYAFILVVLDVI